MLLHDRTNTSSAYLVNLHIVVHGYCTPTGSVLLSLVYCLLAIRQQVSNKCIAVRKVATPPRELTCHMGSHSVTCHSAEMTFPPLAQPKLVLD